jgi:hypothetical protein
MTGLPTPAQALDLCPVGRSARFWLRHKGAASRRARSFHHESEAGQQASSGIARGPAEEP